MSNAHIESVLLLRKIGRFFTWSKLRLGETMPEHNWPLAGVESSSTGRNPMCSSERGGAETDVLWQEVCQETMLEETFTTKEECVEAIRKRFGKAALFTTFSL